MSLQATVDLYRAAHGEPEYRYFKKRIAWVPPSRRGHSGEHVIPIGDGEEIERDEYEANIAEYEKVRREAFLNKHPKGYWRYDMKMIKPGWRERLIEDVERYEPAAVTE